MKTYFLLQYKILNRKILEFGIAPWVAYVLLPIIFTVSSILLFSKLAYANYIYIATALFYLLKLNISQRNIFLQTLFKPIDYYYVRAIENTLISLPFLLFLFSKKLFLSTLILFLLSLLMIFLKQKRISFFTMPTPFSSNPFEFSIGFRENFFVFPLLLFLCFKSVSVGNFNLGIFTLFSTTLVCLSFYNKLENPYFVWLFNRFSPKQFLFNKAKISSKYFMFLSLPILLPLMIFFSDKLEIIALVYLLSFCYLITIVFAKYANFPHKIGLLEVIIITIGFIFFPLLLILIPYFYTRALEQLKSILE